MDDVWPDGKVDLTLRTREPQSRLERLQQRVLRQAENGGGGVGGCFWDGVKSVCFFGIYLRWVVELGQMET